LQNLSIVRVAKELGVTPALVHYYLAGRDALTSGIMNAFYHEIVNYWPDTTEDWENDLHAASQIKYNTMLRYPGVAVYLAAYNRFRMVQLVAADEIDYGLLVFERYVGTVRRAGFNADKTAMDAHLLNEYVTASANATIRHRWPGEHEDFLRKSLARLDPTHFPNFHYIRESFLTLDGARAFAEGLRIFLQGLRLGYSGTATRPSRQGEESDRI
jgi:AcrR family transcriptional regulator